MNAIAAGADRLRPERAQGEARQSGARERNRPRHIAVGVFHIRINDALIAETIRQKRLVRNWTPYVAKGGSVDG